MAAGARDLALPGILIHSRPPQGLETPNAHHAHPPQARPGHGPLARLEILKFENLLIKKKAKPRPRVGKRVQLQMRHYIPHTVNFCFWG